MREYEVRFVSNGGEIRWFVVEAESEDDAWRAAFDETYWDYGDGGICKIIDVTEC